MEPQVKCRLSHAILEIHQQDEEASPGLCPSDGRSMKLLEYLPVIPHDIRSLHGSVYAVESICFPGFFNNVAIRTLLRI